ncbi:MAG: hypothetical protein Q8P18_03610 [Pseudomonadota bacterium]|nr:hypothetical protein [Pseudomonadota bacterium]
MMLLWSGLALAAAPAGPEQWTVTVDPLTVALGFVHVQVEHTLGERASIYVGPSLRLYDGLLGPSAHPYVGFGGEVGVRGFVWGKAPRGAWVMARGVLADVVAEGKGELGGYTSALVGFTGILGPGLVLSGGAGVSYFDYGPAYGIHGVLPALHTNIGWAF